MGGAATNSGINYQQRIAALVLAAQYTEFDLSQTFGIGQELSIESVHFETDTPIDDLKVSCKNQQLYLQIKRSLSLQTDEGTDLYKTIEQFVIQSAASQTNDEHYLLVTSSQSSRTVTQDLLKVTESIRLNDSSFTANPLNKSEQDTFEKFKNLFLLLFEKLNQRQATDAEFVAFAKKVYVTVVDIEQGRPDERVAIILLRSQNLLDANLVWKMLIANCLEYGRNRQSINKKALDEILDRYRIEKPEKEPSDYDALEKYFQTEIISKGQFPVAKEVLLIESFVDNADYLLTELFRFTDDGEIKHKFSGNKIKLRDTDEEWTIVHRAATFAGMERFISKNEDQFSDKKVAIIPANDIDDAESTDAATLHRKFLVELQGKNKDILKCLHCDKALSPNESTIVEIDDSDTKAALGAVHFKCIRLIDRVIGVIGLKEEDKRDVHLQSFDYKEWARLMMKGQGMVNQIKSNAALNDRDKVIAWSSDNKEFRDYSYCLKFMLQDGSTVHMTDRGRIHRFSKSDAEDTKNQMMEGMTKAKEDGNPMCYTSPKLIFGDYNQLLEVKGAEETIVEVESIEVDRYSKLLEKRDEHINFYAPICILRDLEEETIITIGNAIPFISDPLAFKPIFDTWKNIGLELNLEELELKIIKSDVEFDGYMRELFADGMMPIVDPMFNKKGELVKGTKIMHMEQQLAGKSEELRTVISNPNWKKGDKVRLEIPTIQDSNYPTGVLLEDEFQGEDGQPYVIFRPIENGEELEDLAYAVPSNILGRVSS